MSELSNREKGMIIVVDVLKTAAVITQIGAQISEILQKNSTITPEHLEEIKRLRFGELDGTIARIDALIEKAEAETPEG